MEPATREYDEDVLPPDWDYPHLRGRLTWGRTAGPLPWYETNPWANRWERGRPLVTT